MGETTKLDFWTELAQSLRTADRVLSGLGPERAPALASAIIRTHNPPMARRPILAGRTERLEIRCSPEEREAWETAATADRGRQLSDWARYVLGQAAAAEKTRVRRNRQG